MSRHAFVSVCTGDCTYCVLWGAGVYEREQKRDQERERERERDGVPEASAFTLALSTALAPGRPVSLSSCSQPQPGLFLLSLTPLSIHIL